MERTEAAVGSMSPLAAVTVTLEGAGKCSVDAPVEGEATLRQLEPTIYFSINIPSFSLCECVDFTHLKASVSIFAFLQPYILNKYDTLVSLNH